MGEFGKWRGVIGRGRFENGRVGSSALWEDMGKEMVVERGEACW